MTLFIDGYNLLHASGIFGSMQGPPTLERSRGALVAFLAASLSDAERKRTTIIFDAADAPPGLPASLTHEGLSLRFAPRKSSADDLLEELISAEPDPRNLLVVSSDHRIQRAARQRGAKYEDSDVWFRILAQQVKLRGKTATEEKPSAGGSNPFPPGYADDLAEELKAFGKPRPGRPGRGKKS